MTEDTSKLYLNEAERFSELDVGPRIDDTSLIYGVVDRIPISVPNCVSMSVPVYIPDEAAITYLIDDLLKCSLKYVLKAF